MSDVVSAADHAAEELVTARLAEHRGDDGLVGEEGARRSGDGRTWYVDPVDGTYNFLSGLPYWCSAVGLVDEDGPLVGAVYFPPLDELWVGGRDAPTTLNGVPWPSWSTGRWPTSRSPPTSIRGTWPSGTGSTSWQAVTAAAATVRMLGSASVDLAGVASGRLGIFLQANLQPVGLGTRGRAGASGPAGWPRSSRSATSAGRSPATVSRSPTPQPLSGTDAQRKPVTDCRFPSPSCSRVTRFRRIRSVTRPAPSWATPATAVGSSSW